MAGVADLLKLLLVGGASGASGAAIGAMGANRGGSPAFPGAPPVDPRLEAIKQMTQSAGRQVPMLDPAAREMAMRPPIQGNAQDTQEGMDLTDEMAGDTKNTTQANRVGKQIDDFGNSDGMIGPDASFDELQRAKAAGLISNAEYEDLAMKMRHAAGSQDNDADDDDSLEQTLMRGEGYMHDMILDRSNGSKQKGMTTEEELQHIHDNMGSSGSTDFGGAKRQWEGPPDGVPTKRDQAMLDNNPTDGMINSFIKRFPTWADQNSIGNGDGYHEDDGERGLATSEGDYAIDKDELRKLYRNRKTRIDER